MSSRQAAMQLDDGGDTTLDMGVLCGFDDGILCLLLLFACVMRLGCCLLVWFTLFFASICFERYTPFVKCLLSHFYCFTYPNDPLRLILRTD